MKLPEISFHKANSIQEASTLNKRYGLNSKIIAGGTDVVVDLKQGRYYVEHLISISQIDELKGISIENGSLRIGALATIDEIENNKIIKERIAGLSEAAKQMASPPVRNLGTIGGNIAGGIPSADLPPILVALNATTIIYNEGKEKELPLKNLFLNARQTILQPGDIIKYVIIQLPDNHTGTSYQKFGLREANACTVAGVAAKITLENEVIQDAAIVLSAVSPTPLFAQKASDYLTGKKPAIEFLRKAAAIAKEECQPITDIRGSVEYRRHLVEVLAYRALSNALSNIVIGDKP